MCLPATLESVSCQKASKGAHRLSRRTLLAGGGGAAAAAAFPATASAVRPAKHRFQDLTHVLTEGFPVFTFDPPTRETLTTIPGDGFYAQHWTLAEHSGTHVDVPGHFIVGGRLAPEITPEELIVPIVVIDISERAARDSDTVLTVDDLRRFERRNGRIPNGALVCMDSGWAAKVDDSLAYKGGPAFPDYHFPGFDLDAAMWLAERRDVAGLGVDTLSIDPGNSTTFPVHVDFLATDRYGVENLNNLDRIPPRGAVAYVGLIPLQEGSGGPSRVIANW
ncbi:MAG: cyclase family protein [Kribbellaceae bacterium]